MAKRTSRRASKSKSRKTMQKRRTQGKGGIKTPLDKIVAFG